MNSMVSLKVPTIEKEGEGIVNYIIFTGKFKFPLPFFSQHRSINQRTPTIPPICLARRESETGQTEKQAVKLASIV